MGIERRGRLQGRQEGHAFRGRQGRRDIWPRKAQTMGLKEIAVIVKGVGSGRESAIRGFISKGFGITSIKDETPVPFNGPKPKKPRRV